MRTMNRAILAGMIALAGLAAGCGSGIPWSDKVVDERLPGHWKQVLPDRENVRPVVEDLYVFPHHDREYMATMSGWLSMSFPSVRFSEPEIPFFWRFFVTRQGDDHLANAQFLAKEMSSYICLKYEFIDDETFALYFPDLDSIRNRYPGIEQSNGGLRGEDLPLFHRFLAERRDDPKIFRKFAVFRKVRSESETRRETQE